MNFRFKNTFGPGFKTLSFLNPIEGPKLPYIPSVGGIVYREVFLDLINQPLTPLDF